MRRWWRSWWWRWDCELATFGLGFTYQDRILMPFAGPLLVEVGWR